MTEMGTEERINAPFRRMSRHDRIQRRMDWKYIAIPLLVSFIVNLPLGRWRSRQRRYSLKWFLAIHFSIPFIYSLRTYWHLPLESLPFSIGAAVLAQYLGAVSCQTRPLQSSR